ncbi:MAG: tRNA (guanosine(37)-N1)-methyltransferase TrmD [Legionellales bacterium]|nr:tRNA (guanosine(37)-N1)-methyltransferase TrmD [Legionellales bacterium]
MNTAKQIGVIALFPPMFNALDYGITGRAQQQKLLNIHYWNPRDYSDDPHQRIDDRPYGGGPGMVMAAPPLDTAIQAARQHYQTASTAIYLSPQGQPLTQAKIQQWTQTPQPLIFIAGRYEGIDERLLELSIDEQWSLGDYVLSGGELAIMVVIDALTRLLPGALGDATSADQDSFSRGLLDWPHYTRPQTYRQLDVPTVLRSGDHQAIARWRLKQALGKTWQKRPDLLKRATLSADERQLLLEYQTKMRSGEQHD